MASVVVKTRQHLAAVLVHDRVLVLDILRYASELRDPSRLRVPGDRPEGLRISDRELKMAERLVAEMTEDWDPKQYHDEYRDELLAFIKKRGRAGKVTLRPETEEEPRRRNGPTSSTSRSCSSGASPRPERTGAGLGDASPPEPARPRAKSR